MIHTRENGNTFSCAAIVQHGQDGVALLTVMLMLLIMTVLGIASITVTGLENRMSGFMRTNETSATAAESCLGVGANIIKQAWLVQNAAAIPASFLSTAVPPGPVPAANATMLRYEIKGRDDLGNDMSNNIDTATGSPNIAMNVNGFAVNGDIDRLYSQNTVGTSSSSGSPAVSILYRISCTATNVAVGTTSPATAVYSCTKVGGGAECAVIIG